MLSPPKTIHTHNAHGVRYLQLVQYLHPGWELQLDDGEPGEPGLRTLNISGARPSSSMPSIFDALDGKVLNRWPWVLALE